MEFHHRFNLHSFGLRRKVCIVKKANENDIAPSGGDKADPPSESFPEISPFKWDLQRNQAAISLASGYTHQHTAEQVECDKRTITNWLQHPDFAAEVDRLSLMVDVSSRAERLRIAMRAIRQSVKGNEVATGKDILEWLKFAQSETDGVKLDLTKLAALGEADPFMAVGGSAGTGESEAVN